MFLHESSARPLEGYRVEVWFDDGRKDEPRINTKTYGPPLLRRRHGLKPTRERGRFARERQANW